MRKNCFSDREKTFCKLFLRSLKQIFQKVKGQNYLIQLKMLIGENNCYVETRLQKQVRNGILFPKLILHNVRIVFLDQYNF